MHTRAQGGVEYLLIIAAVIIIVGIVVIALASFMGAGKQNLSIQSDNPLQQLAQGTQTIQITTSPDYSFTITNNPTPTQTLNKVFLTDVNLDLTHANTTTRCVKNNGVWTAGCSTITLTQGDNIRINTIPPGTTISITGTSTTAPSCSGVARACTTVTNNTECSTYIPRCTWINQYACYGFAMCGAGTTPQNVQSLCSSRQPACMFSAGNCITLNGCQAFTGRYNNYFCTQIQGCSWAANPLCIATATYPSVVPCANSSSELDCNATPGCLWK